MIELTGYNNNKPIKVDERNIARVTDGHDLIGDRTYPWSDVVIDDGSKEKTIRVVESAKTVGRLMIEAMGLAKKKNKEKQNE